MPRIVLSAVAALVLCAAFAAPPALAADDQPCGSPATRNAGGAITTQQCPIWLPKRLGHAPVHAFAPGPVERGRLVQGGSVNWFLCQARGPALSEGAYRNVWWALTLSDDGHRGWVNEVYFSGGGNDEADAGLRGCGAADLDWARAGGAGVPDGAGAPVPTPAPAPGPAPAPDPAPGGPAPAPASGPYSVLQINICHSGHAPCFQRSGADRAADLIVARRPSAVTVNEACEPDLARIRARTGYTGAFTQSGTQTCTNGSRYGNMVLFPAGTPLGTADPVTYRRQAPGAGERRTLLCLPGGGVTVCATHLGTGKASGKETEEQAKATQRAQAAQMRDVVSRYAAAGPTLLGGDLNLRYGGDPDAQSYVPAGMVRKGDGSVQHVFASRHFRVTGTRVMSLSWTDHPALQVSLTR